MNKNSGKGKRDGLKTASECIDNAKKPDMKDFAVSCVIPTVVLCRTSGAVEAVNDAFLRLTGLSASDIPNVAAMAKRLFPCNESASRLQTLVSANSICSGIFSIVPIEGGTVSATAHVSPLLSGMEMTDYSVMQIIDVNRTPDADDYRILFDNVPISIWKYDFSETLKLRKEIEAAGAIDFRNYFSKHPELFRRVIESLKVIDVNEETLKLYGASSKDEMLGYLGGNTLPESAESIANAITAYMKGERYYECETVNKTLDGRLLHIIYRITFPENNRLSKTALATVINISSRKQAEYDLIDSETKYRTTLDAIADPIILTDRSYTILMANQSCIECCKRRGMSPDIIGKNLFDMFPFLTQKSREEYEYAFSTGETVEREEHVVFEGTEHIAETRKTPISSDGEDSRMLTVIHYVTEQKRMERALRESEERYRLMFDVIPAAVFEYDFSEALGEIDRLKEMECTDYRRFLDEHPDFLMTLIGKIRLADINQETLLLYNAPTKKAFFNAFGQQTTPEALLTFRNAIDAYLRGQTSYTTETVNKTIDGEIINILYKVTFPEDRKLLSRAIVTVIDITKRKAIEEKLRQQSEAMEASADGIAIVDANGDYIHMNESYVRKYGYDSKRELVGKNWNIHYSPDEYNHIVDGLTGSASGEKQWRGEAVGIRRDGGTFPQEASFTTIEGGGLICVIRDITERKKSERALRDSEERFRLIADLSPFPISFIDKDGRYLYVNDRFTEVFGYTIEDIPSGQDWFRLAFPNASQREKIIETWKHDAAGTTKGSMKPRMYKVRCRNGIERDIIFRTVLTGDGRQYITYEDITERRRVEEERIKVSKLDSLGILAGGIAHDFNNILTAILGNISLAKTFIDENDRAYQRLTKSENACFRAQDLTGQLLAFSRGGAPIREAASIAEIIEESANFSLIGSNVRCEFDIADDLYPVHVDKGQISQVINNLIINADQSMPDGGTIHLKVKNVSNKDLPFSGASIENFVCITVQDKGIGIPEEHFSKIFDPYFTTKEKGRGLGLATTYAIIRRHEGHITVQSSIGSGTTISIYLPALPNDMVLPDVRETPVEIVETGPLKVLVMDDEKEIRALLSEMLEYLGHSADTSANGEEGIEKYRCAKQSSHPFDLVIMDLTVPGGMGGREMIRHLLEIDPDVRAVVTSGYSNDPVLANYSDYGFLDFIPKPFQFDRLKDVLKYIASNS